MSPHDQHDPERDTIAEVQRSIMATLTYLMGHASLAEIFGLQGYLSQLASQMTPPDAGHQRHPPMPAVLRDQLAERQRQSHAMKDAYALGVLPESRNVAQP